jgi:hypothetical protein
LRTGSSEQPTFPREFRSRLDPYVRAKFDELWQASQHPEDDY